MVSPRFSERMRRQLRRKFCPCGGCRKADQPLRRRYNGGMEMATVVLALATIYLIVSFIGLLAWPIRRLSDPVLDAKWQKAIYAAIYGPIALTCIAWLLIFLLPTRLLWIPLALCFIGPVIKNQVIRSAMRHARPGSSDVGLQRN